MFRIFHFLRSDVGFGIINPFRWKNNAISSEKGCLILMPFLLALIPWNSESNGSRYFRILPAKGAATFG